MEYNLAKIVGYTYSKDEKNIISSSNRKLASKLKMLGYDNNLAEVVDNAEVLIDKQIVDKTDRCLLEVIKQSVSDGIQKVDIGMFLNKAMKLHNDNEMYIDYVRGFILSDTSIENGKDSMLSELIRDDIKYNWGVKVDWFYGSKIPVSDIYAHELESILNTYKGVLGGYIFEVLQELLGTDMIVICAYKDGLHFSSSNDESSSGYIIQVMDGLKGEDCKVVYKKEASELLNVSDMYSIGETSRKGIYLEFKAYMNRGIGAGRDTWIYLDIQIKGEEGEYGYKLHSECNRIYEDL